MSQFAVAAPLKGEPVHDVAGALRLRGVRWPKRRTARGSAPPALPVLPDEPVSRTFGFERGKPVDRWYIERFLAEHSADVRGRVLEVAESTYTGWYGGDDVTRSDVLYAAEGNPDATVVGDLTTGAGIPEAAYDCFICTQTLQFIYDVRAAVAGTRALLAPGGVLLATVPGISQISREDMRDWGDWWRFTAKSASGCSGRSTARSTSRCASTATSRRPPPSCTASRPRTSIRARWRRWTPIFTC